MQRTSQGRRQRGVLVCAIHSHSHSHPGVEGRDSSRECVLEGQIHRPLAARPCRFYKEWLAPCVTYSYTYAIYVASIICKNSSACQKKTPVSCNSVIISLIIGSSKVLYLCKFSKIGHLIFIPFGVRMSSVLYKPLEIGLREENRDDFGENKSDEKNLFISPGHPFTVACSYILRLKIGLLLKNKLEQPLRIT